MLCVKKISSAKKETPDSQSPQNIGQQLRRRQNMVVAPIDLSFEAANPLNTKQLRWMNFYEPPLRLTLKNTGDAVIVEGHWLHHRPCLSGGPLDDCYVFSHMHYHWDTQKHESNKHSINGKNCPLELHALFFKAVYKTLTRAQEEEDGIIIIVYFFKVDKQSSFKWFCDQLEHVTGTRSITLLPPAPLGALMVPFTRDYLVYWGELPYSCHPFLWVVSRTALRVTIEELDQFRKVNQSINNDNCIKIAKTPKNVIFHMNPSNYVGKILYCDAVDPPCYISSRSDKETIVVKYHQKMTSDGDLAPEPYSGVLQPECTFEERGTSMSNSDMKKESQSSGTNDQLKYRHSATQTYIIKGSDHSLTSKQCILISKRRTLERERILISRKFKMLKRKLLEIGNQEKEAVRSLLREKEEIELMKRALREELKRLAKETLTKRDGQVDLPKPLVSPRQKLELPQNNEGVLTSKFNSISHNPNSVLIERENVKASKEGNSEIRKCSTNTQTETRDGQNTMKEEKEEKEIKKKATPSKSRIPRRKFTPWRPLGLQSTLTPYFSSAKAWQHPGKQPESPRNNMSISTLIPKFNRRALNRTVILESQQDLAGKGDHLLCPKTDKGKPTCHSVPNDNL